MFTSLLLYLLAASVDLNQNLVFAKTNFSRPTNTSCITNTGDPSLLPNPAIRCPNPPEPNFEKIYSSREDSFPDQECAMCSLQLDQENTGVLVRCYRCQKAFKPPELMEQENCIDVTAAELKKINVKRDNKK
ncbi:hypothetical protein Zmor_018418 [Zophobas morio]|uniref:Secreted protein n=1 Tax=Zophobas morio TaxID=2755281 RepID=A0AA38IAL2_9CUCU|nr:hypothetical protein Zmor_018418 [Zophobas morio]